MSDNEGNFKLLHSPANASPVEVSNASLVGSLLEVADFLEDVVIVDSKLFRILRFLKLNKFDLNLESPGLYHKPVTAVIYGFSVIS
jgi:hypothetical protein